jgi:hypothetical protein
MDWPAYAATQASRYEDGEARLSPAGDARQKQLVRMAMAAGAVGLARLMQGRPTDASAWLIRSAEGYRESFERAPPESWGRPIGALKARLLAGDRTGAENDARWTLAAGAGASTSPVGQYAAVLALLVLGEDAKATTGSRILQSAEEDSFPRPVADALAALAASDARAYERAVQAVLVSFEERDAYLEDAPVADTVLVLQALAAPRTLAVSLSSPLLPPRRGARSRT